MEILLITIGIPTLGALMLFCRRELMETVNLDRRELCQTFLAVLSILLLLSATYLTANGILELVFNLGNFFFWNDIATWLVALLRISFVGIILWTAMTALQISREKFRNEPSIIQLTAEARRRQTLLLGSIALIALPLLVFGAWIGLIVWFVGYIEFAVLEVVYRSRESRLLWTLTMAARFQRPFAQEVAFLARTEVGSHQKRLESLAVALEDGSSLSLALQAIPKLMRTELVVAIQAGERTGQLDRVLQSLAAKQSSKVLRWFSMEMRGNSLLFQAMVSLSILVSMAGFIITFIIPKFKAIFNDFGVELPGPTIVFIQLADVVLDYWFLFFPFFMLPVCVVFYLVMLNLGYQGRYASLANGIWPRIQTPGLLRTLSVAVHAQANPVLVLEGFSSGAGSIAQRMRYERLCLRMMQGSSLSNSLRAERIINQREANAIDIAESRGHLAWALDSIAERIELNRSNRVSVILEVLQPVVILFLGLLVAGYCFSLFAPLIKLLNDLS